MNRIAMSNHVLVRGRHCAIFCRVTSLVAALSGGSALFAQQDLYVSLDDSIAKISPAGAYSTFANGIGLSDALAFAPDGSGYLYVAAERDNLIDKVAPDGTVSVFASGINHPAGLAFDASGNLFVSSIDATIKKVTPAGAVSTFVTLPAYADGIEFDSAGNLYAAEFNSGVIAKITPAGSVSNFASGFSALQDLKFDASGNLYASDYGGHIARITPSGVRSTFASLNGPVGIDFDASGRLFVAQYNVSSIAAVAPDGTVQTFVTGLPNPPRFLIAAPVPEPNTFLLSAMAIIAFCSTMCRLRVRPLSTI